MQVFLSSFGSGGKANTWAEPYACLIEGENPLPVLLHVDHVPPVHRRGLKRLVKFAKMRLAIVGVFAVCVGVVQNQAKPGAAGAKCRPLQHFEIAVGIAERCNGATTDMLVDAHGLSGFVVDKVDVGQPDERWRAGLDLKSCLDRRSNHLLRW